MKRAQFLQFLCCSMVLSACQPFTTAMDLMQPLDFANSEIDQVTYRFTDSSVPPRYHRSYSIIVTAQVLSITVDSYGDVIAQQELPSSPEQFQSVLAALDQARIRKGSKPLEDGCAGGTSDRITAHHQGESIFDSSRYNCGGKSGPLKGDIAAVKAHLQGLIPDFTKLIKA